MPGRQTPRQGVPPSCEPGILVVSQPYCAHGGTWQVRASRVLTSVRRVRGECYRVTRWHAGCPSGAVRRLPLDWNPGWPGEPKPGALDV